MCSTQRKVIAAQTITEEGECLLQKFEPNNALQEDFLAFKKCNLWIDDN